MTARRQVSVYVLCTMYYVHMYMYCIWTITVCDTVIVHPMKSVMFSLLVNLVRGVGEVLTTGTHECSILL